LQIGIKKCISKNKIKKEAPARTCVWGPIRLLEQAHTVPWSAGVAAGVAVAAVHGGCLLAAARLDADPHARMHVGLLAVLVNVGTFHVGFSLIAVREIPHDGLGVSPSRSTIISNYKILVKSSCG
jgi:hypothetical protein